MDSSKISQYLAQLQSMMLQKGVKMLDPSFYWSANSQPVVMLHTLDPDATKPGGNFGLLLNARRDTPEECFEAAFEFAKKMPTAEERAKAEFLVAMADVIHMGKERGIDVQFLNPLQETMQRLSENALTDQRQTEDPYADAKAAS